MTLSLTIVTSIPSPHQIPLAKALNARLPGKFKMVCTQPIASHRLGMGWEDSCPDAEWMLRIWQSETARQAMSRAISESDAVIYGAIPANLIRERILTGKLTFRYSERLFKHGAILGFPWWFRRLWRDFWPLDLPNHHLLCSGAYCAPDHQKMHVFKARMWKWGYFTEVPGSPPPGKRQTGKMRLLWAGRMVGWKSVDLILKATQRIRHSAAPFSVDLIGDGPERKRLTALCEKLKIQEVVRFLPSMPIAQVQSAMKDADIYVMPSNYGEGWGAVINEAMASGCCVVSSNGPGAAPWLIDHGQNGYVFPSGNLNALCDILTSLINNPMQPHSIGQAAWQKIHAVWSPEAAADRFIHLAENLLGHVASSEFIEGPCSKA